MVKLDGTLSVAEHQLCGSSVCQSSQWIMKWYITTHTSVNMKHANLLIKVSHNHLSYTHPAQTLLCSTVQYAYCSLSLVVALSGQFCEHSIRLTSELYPQCHWHTTARSSVSIVDLHVDGILNDFIPLLPPPFQ